MSNKAAVSKAVSNASVPKGEKRHGIVLDEMNQEQPADKDRARTATRANKIEEDDELQPLREKSGF